MKSIKDTKSHSVMECYKADARIEELEEQLASARKVINRCAAQVGHPPIAPGELGIESVAEAVERHAAYAREREETLDSITPENLQAFAASEAHHEEHHQREAELEAQLAKLQAKWPEVEQVVSSVETQLAKADERASKAEARVAELGEECRKMTDEIERLSVAVEWVLQEIREKIAVERGIKTASIEEYFRVYKRISISFYDKDVARLQAALNPDTRQEGDKDENKTRDRARTRKTTEKPEISG